jgi:hypothetical protein
MPKALPDVDDLDSYIDKRVNDQIDWYHRKAVGYKHRATQLRWVGNALAAIAALLGVAAAVLDQTNLAAWVPFLTTVGTSLVAYIAASRYDHMIIEYLRTEQQLEHLRDTRTDNKMSDSKFIDACESVISIENQVWMTRGNDPDQPD